MFECKICNYSTERSADLKRHNKSNKHILNEQKIAQKPIENYKKLENENNELKNELKEIKNQYGSLVTLALQNSKTAKQSVRGITYAMRHYKSAPDVKLLEGKEAIKLLTYDNKKSPTDTVDIIIKRHRNKKLKEHLGDILIDAYKKDDPKLQSFWGVDTSRLHFILKKTEWTSDKSGINLTKLLIDPFLNKVDEMIRKYLKDGCKNMIDSYSTTTDNFPTNVLLCNEILVDISKKTLHKKILKYISPHFELTSCGVNDKQTKNSHSLNTDELISNDSESETDSCSSESVSSSSSDRKPRKITQTSKQKKKIVVSKKYESSSSDSN